MGTIILTIQLIGDTCITVYVATNVGHINIITYYRTKRPLYTGHLKEVILN